MRKNLSVKRSNTLYKGSKFDVVFPRAIIFINIVIISGRSVIRFHISQAVCIILKLIPKVSFKGYGLFALSMQKKKKKRKTHWKTEVMLLSSCSQKFCFPPKLLKYRIWHLQQYLQGRQVPDLVVGLLQHKSK